MYPINPFLFQVAADQCASARYRIWQELVGPINGVNTSYVTSLGENFVHNQPYLSIEVYYNGIRLQLGEDYTVIESGGPNTGYDTVVFTFPPMPGDILRSNYVASAGEQPVGLGDQRTGQILTGAKDGLNATFGLPLTEKFVHNLPFATIEVYHNGVHLSLMNDYVVAESGGAGTGYDLVILEVPPEAGEHLLADYTEAT